MKSRIIEIVNEISGLPSEDKKYVISCIDSNEWEVAFDYLCNKILENEINITKEIYNSIEGFGKEFSLNESRRHYWTPIQYLVKDK